MNNSMREYNRNRVIEAVESEAMAINGLDQPLSECEEELIEKIIATLSSNNLKFRYDGYNKPRLIQTKRQFSSIKLDCSIRIYVADSKVILRAGIPICIMQDSIGNEALNTCILAQTQEFGTLKRNRDGEIFIQYAVFMKDCTKYDRDAFLFYLKKLIEEAEQCYISLKEIREELYKCLYRIDIEYMAGEDEP